MTVPAIISTILAGAGPSAGAVVAAAVGYPAAKALSRLVTGTFDIGVAYVERPAALVRAKTAEIVQDRAHAAELARSANLEDGHRLERAAVRQLQNQDRKQANIEAVAQRAFEDLSAKPPEGDAVVSEEFMAAFEPLAEGASSEEARALFSKVLASECRKPGSFSKRALAFLNQMDGEQAAEVEKWAGLAWGTDSGPLNLPSAGPFGKGLLLYSHRIVDSYGLIASGITAPVQGNDEGRSGFILKDCIIFAEGLSGHVSLSPLSPLGIEIFRLVWRPPTEADLALFKEWLVAAGASKVTHYATTREPPGLRAKGDGRVL